MKTLLFATAALAIGASATTAHAQRNYAEDCARITRNAPTGFFEDCMNRLHPPSISAINGTWTGHEGSPRDRAWVASCRPAIVHDRHGMPRYVYAKPGCDTGEQEGN